MTEEMKQPSYHHLLPYHQLVTRSNKVRYRFPKSMSPLSNYPLTNYKLLLLQHEPREHGNHQAEHAQDHTKQHLLILNLACNPLLQSCA